MCPAIFRSPSIFARRKERTCVETMKSPIHLSTYFSGTPPSPQGIGANFRITSPSPEGTRRNFRITPLSPEGMRRNFRMTPLSPEGVRRNFRMKPLSPEGVRCNFRITPPSPLRQLGGRPRHPQLLGICGGDDHKTPPIIWDWYKKGTEIFLRPPKGQCVAVCMLRNVPLY